MDKTPWQEFTEEVHTVLGKYMKDTEADQVLKDLFPLLHKTFFQPVRVVHVTSVERRSSRPLSTDVGTELVSGMPGHPDNDMGM